MLKRQNYRIEVLERFFLSKRKVRSFIYRILDDMELNGGEFGYFG